MTIKENKMDSAELLLTEIINSGICKGCYPPNSKPLLNFSSKSKILIVGQAPGIKAIESGIPWNDASGKRLREWMDNTSAEVLQLANSSISRMDSPAVY